MDLFFVHRPLLSWGRRSTRPGKCVLCKRGTAERSLASGLLETNSWLRSVLELPPQALIARQMILAEARHREGKKPHPLRQAHRERPFQGMDAKGRSLAADRRRKAKTHTKSGFGDQGDRST
jgi:hypothetical protein